MNRLLSTCFIVASALALSTTCRADIWADVVRSIANPVNLLTQAHRDVPPQPAEVQPPVAVIAPPAPVVVVSETDQTRLVDSIQELSKQSAEKLQTKIPRLLLGSSLVQFFLESSRRLAGFCKASTLAGILSILTTGAVGANNTLPFREHANTYRVVSVQARALEVDARLNTAMTKDAYRAYTQKLYSLAIIGDDKPATGSPQELEHLLEQLHSADTASDKQH